MKSNSAPGRVLFAWICAIMLSCSLASQARPSRALVPQGSGQAWSIPADTIISVQMRTTLTSRTAHVGDRFSATVAVPVYVNGAQVIPAGAVVEGRISQVTPARRMSRSGAIAVEFDDLVFPSGQRVPLVGVLTSDDPATRRRIDDESRVSAPGSKRPVVFVGGGGVLGAVLGGIAGGGKGAAVGGAAGVGAGVAAVLLSKGEEAEVPAGTAFGIQLRQPLTIGDVSLAASDPAQSTAPVNGPDPAADPSVNAPLRRDSADAANNSAPDRDPAPDRDSASERDSTSADPTAGSGADSTADPVPSDNQSAPSASEMIRRAQVALREQGYYEGASDGVMNTRTANALKTYQREHKLAETGEVDSATAKSLGITGAPPPAAKPPVQTRPPQQADVPGVRTSPPPTTTTSQPADRQLPQTRQPANTTSRQPANQQSNQQPTQTSDNRSRSVPASSSRLDQQMAALMSDYQRLAGVRLTDSGIEIDDRSRYGEPEVELLFALDSFANAVQLYGELMATLQSGKGSRGAVLGLAKQARRTDITVATSTCRTAKMLAPKWDLIRQEVLRMMRSYDIEASELDN